MKAPVLYLPHGGGPLPLLDDPAHAALIDFLRGIGARFQKPEAIVLVSGHWEARVPAINNGAAPALLYDYYGFPPETYAITYPAPGNPQLASRIGVLLQEGGFAYELDDRRGFDHGVFVPLKLVYPAADVPVVQLSLIKGLDPQAHIRMGRCLESLREQNVAIIGSGMSFHNLQAIFAGPRPDLQEASARFDGWLRATLGDAALAHDARTQKLCDWLEATPAGFCHPREEHLMPLLVCYGATGLDPRPAEVIFSEPLMGHRVSGFGWFS